MTPWVKRLLIANVLMFLVEQAAPGVTSLLMLVPRDVLYRPWTVVTYMFLHDPRSIGHILFNMLGLFFFGPRVEARLGSNRFIALYLISGIAGALASIVMAPNSAVYGASGAVLGVLLAFARFWPREQLLIWGIIPIEARWLIIIYAAFDILGGFRGIGMPGIANFAHLGGLVGALLYLLYLDRRQGARRFKATATPKVSDNTLGGWQKVDRNSIHAVNRDEVDRILDKINAKGIASLTPQERQFLSNFVPPDDRKPA